MGRLQDRVAIITGVTSGIGKAAARLFAEEGAKVVLGARRTEEGEAVAHEIVAAGGEAEFVTTDVARTEDLQNIVKVAEDRFGALHLAFNNAGTSNKKELIASMPEEEFERVIRINLTSVFLAMQAQIPAMLRAGGGAIVNTSSVGGLVGTPTLSAYQSAKHGVIGLTKVGALEYAKQNIRVNAICPGGTHSEMFDGWLSSNAQVAEMLTAAHPIGRFADAIEPARAAAFLLSDDASFITGVALPVDGGLVAQ